MAKTAVDRSGVLSTDSEVALDYAAIASDGYGRTMPAIPRRHQPSIRDKVIFSRVGFELPESITFDEWKEIAEIVVGADDGIKWWIGDTIRAYKEIWGWGSMYELAHQMFPRYKVRALESMVYVANSVQFTLRRVNLTWSHHKVAASLTNEKQAAALKYAEDNRLSVAEFRAYVNERKLQLPSDEQRNRQEWISARMNKLRTVANTVLVRGEHPNPQYYESMKAEIEELLAELDKRMIEPDAE